MIKSWEERPIITANLFNPAFCGEVIRRTVQNFNDNDKNLKLPFSLVFLILPLVLHKKTREKMPLRSSTYFHSWVESNEYLFLDFAERTRIMLPYSKEALSFLMIQGAISIDTSGLIDTNPYRKKNPIGEGVEEVSEIFKKAELLGKWLRLTGNPQTIFMFLKIRP